MHRLTDEVKSLIRTGVALPSVTQVIEELLLNSIDAGATNIAVRVDLSCFKIQVVDNGHGITADQFELIGERYATSKCHSAKDLESLKHYGYRGEALASIKNTSSFLEIVSRAKGSNVTFSKCFHQGKKSLLSRVSNCRPSAGTTITVHNLFYNLPVRQIKSNVAIEIERIRYRVCGLALMWPNIGISIRNDSVGQVVLQTKKCHGTLGVFYDLFASIRPTDILEMSLQKEDISLWGFISKEGNSHKDIQFVYINKRIVLNSCIHKLVNRILGHSVITKRREQSTADVLPTTGSPSKNVDLFGIFLLNISCPFNFYDITFDPKKTLVEFSNQKKLNDLIQDMVYDLLRKEKLLCDELSSRVNSDQRSIPSIVVQPTGSLQVEDEQSKNSDEANSYVINHPNILFSKPVKKWNKNLFHCRSQSGVQTEQGVGLSGTKEDEKSLFTDTGLEIKQQTSEDVESCATISDIELCSHSTHDESMKSSISSHCNISSGSQSEIRRALKHCSNQTGANSKNRFGSKSNKPELSKISVDKSVTYVSTLSCLRQFVSTKRNKGAVNHLANTESVTIHENPSKLPADNDYTTQLNTLTEVRNVANQNSNINDVPMIHTLSELRNAARPIASAGDDVAKINSLTELERSAHDPTANVQNLSKIKVLPRVKSATLSSGNVMEVQGINTLTELKKSTRLLADVNVPKTIHTLTELRKATKSTINSDTVLQTPCQKKNGDEFSGNDLEEIRDFEDKESLAISNISSDNEMSRVTDSNEFMLQTPESNLELDCAGTFSHKEKVDTPIKNNNHNNRTELIKNNEVTTICSNPYARDVKSLSSKNWRKVSQLEEDNIIPVLLQESDIYYHEKNKFSRESVTTPDDLVVNYNAAPMTNVVENEVIISERVSSKNNKTDHFPESMGQNAIDASLQNIPVCPSKHFKTQDPQSNLPVISEGRNHGGISDVRKPSLFSDSKNDSVGKMGLEYPSNNLCENPCVNDNLRNEASCSSTMLSSNYFSSAKHSQNLSQDERYLSPKKFSCTLVNKLEKVGDKLSRQRSEDELFTSTSNIIVSGSFNLKPVMEHKTTNSNVSLSLLSKNHSSLLRINSLFNYDITMKVNPRSNIFPRKRKLFADLKLSAPKRFHCRIFQDNFGLTTNVYLSSHVLKQFFGYFINRPSAGLGEKSMVPALLSEAETRPPIKTLDIVDLSEADVISSMGTFIKESCKSTSHSKYNSAEGEICPKNKGDLEMSGRNKQSHLEMIEVNTQIEEWEGENLSDQKTSAQLLCLQNGKSESIAHSFDLSNEFQSNLQEKTCIIDTSVSTDVDCASDTRFELMKESPNEQDELSRSDGESTSARGLHSDASIRVELNKWKNPVFKKHKLPCLPNQMYHYEGALIKTCYSFVHGLEFSRKMLQDAKVIGQVEMKFIACIIERDNPSTSEDDTPQTFLVLLDQHAVHERVRLESLKRGAEETNTDSENKRLKRAHLDPGVTLPIGKDDARILKAFQAEFERIGVNFRIDPSPHNIQSVVIHSLPLCMTQRDWDGKKREAEEITRNARDLIQDHIQHLKATNGVHGRMPLSVHRVMCSQACRGAIKFGDPVSFELCKQLVHQLSECYLPFQCAHGRPSIVPLVNLTTLDMQSKRKIVKPQLGKLSAHFFRHEDVDMTPKSQRL